MLPIPTNETPGESFAQPVAAGAAAGNREHVLDAPDKIAELMHEIDELKTANQALKDDGRRFAAAAAGLPPPWAEAERLRSENNHLNEKVQGAAGDLAAEKARRLSAEQELQKDAHPTGASAAGANGVQAEAPAVQELVQKLESELAAAKRAQAAGQAEQQKAAEQLKATIREQTDRIAGLQTKAVESERLAHEKEASRNEIADANARLTEEETSMKLELAELRRERLESGKEAASQIAASPPPKTLPDQLSAGRAAVEPEKGNAQKAAAEIADLQRKCAELLRQNTQAQKDARNTASEIADLKGKLAARDGVIAQNAAEKTEREKAAKLQRKSIEDLNAQVAGLQEKAAAAERLARDRDLQDKGMEQLNTQVAGLRAKAAAGEQLARENELQVESIKQLKAQVASLQAEAGKSEKSARESKTESDELARANARLTAGTAATAAQLADLTRKSEAGALAVSAQATAIAQLKTSVDRLAAERTELQKASVQAGSHAQEAAAEAAGLRNELAALQRQKAQIADEVQGKAAEIAELRSKLAARDRAAALGDAELTEEARLLKSQADLLSAKVAATRNDLARYRAGAAHGAAPSSAAGEPSAAPHVHVVVEGDSLKGLSERYYGTADKWPDIFAANREILTGGNALVPGQQLKIP